MSEVKKDGRATLVRNSLLFQVKLLADGFRDFLLVPVSLVATLIGLLRSGEDPEREFEQVLDLGRKTEQWINLFGTHDPIDAPAGAGNIDQLVTKAESVLQEQVRQGDVSEQAGATLARALDALHRRAGGSGTASKDGKASDA